MIDKKASISNASLSPRRRSIMVKEPMKRKIVNIINVAGTNAKRNQISMTLLVWFLMRSGFKVLNRNVFIGSLLIYNI
jgi:hypothetical protein